MRSNLYHSCTRSENHWLFFIGLLVLFNFYEISLLLGTIRDLISEPLGDTLAVFDRLQCREHGLSTALELAGRQRSRLKRGARERPGRNREASKH